MLDKKISAIITCYREEQAIPVMYERLTKVLKELVTNYEIIFINDASPDNTEAILTELASRDKRVVVINQARNFNSPAGIAAGMSIATGDCVVVLDGDLEDPPELIPQMVEKWQQGFEVVYGVRVKREGGTFMLNVGQKLFYRIFQKLSYVKIPLNAGDFSLMDRKVVDIMNSMPERDRFTRGLRAYVGFNQTGIDYVRPKRPFGKSSNNWLKLFWWSKKAIVSFSYKPLELMGYLGFLIVLGSFILVVVYIIWGFIDPASVGARGTRTIIFLILFLGGVQILSISVIGEYIAIIFDEVKGRPTYIIKSILNDPRK